MSVHAHPHLPSSVVRTGTLKELPLGHFLADATSPFATPPPVSPFKAPSKRPLSPGTVFSPAKRRIVAQEGVFAPSPPEKQATSSKSPIRRQTELSKVLNSPHSPARRLDFSAFMPSAKKSLTVGETVPCAGSSSASMLLPSPEFLSSTLSSSSLPKPRVVNESRVDEEIEHHPPPATVSSFMRKLDDASQCASSSTYDQSLTPTTIQMVPREMPPPPAPESIHYPGFDIYQDTHVPVESTILSVNAATTTPSDLEAGFREMELTKENVRPKVERGYYYREEGKKFGIGMGEVMHMGMPNMKFAQNRDSWAGPSSLGPAFGESSATPRSTTRMEVRKAMEDEVDMDDVQSDDDASDGLL